MVPEISSKTESTVRNNKTEKTIGLQRLHTPNYNTAYWSKLILMGTPKIRCSLKG